MASGQQQHNPATWDEYEGRVSPPTSLSPGNMAEEHVFEDDEEDFDEESSGRLMQRGNRRRSSVGNRLSAMADLGGVNSFRSFARSWQRAAGFAEVIPRRPSIVYNQGQPEVSDGGFGIEYSRSHVETPNVRSSLLSQRLQGISHTGVPGGSHCTEYDDTHDDLRSREGKLLDAEIAAGALLPESSSSRASIFAVPHLSSPAVIGSYSSYRSSQYGTLSSGNLRSRTSATSRRRSSVSVHEGPSLGEENAILVKEVKQGDKVVLTVDGQSTLPQSTFNAINAIIGVGMLSLPLAFKMSGWIVGLGILTITAAVAAHTANLLAKCMQHDATLITYSDLAYVSFGTRARVIISALFTMELIAANVALFILFADSLSLLFPSLFGATSWKCVCAVLVLVLNALPLRFLSYTSVIGIFSTFCIVCIVVIDGLLKTESPGSLWQPAVTHTWPTNWLSLPLAYGLMASPWGAHSVFPSHLVSKIYRDMRHPHKWAKAVKATFSFSYLLDTCLAVIGILMFGDGIGEAITSNIIKTGGFPKGLTIFMCACVAIIPLTKIPLNARPIITTADVILGLHFKPQQYSEGDAGGAWTRAVKRAAVRVAVVFVLLVISTLFPAFDSVCAFLGAALCTLISIVFPIAFYLKLFWDEIPRTERIVSLSLIVSFSIFGLVGTIWTFLPKSLVESRSGIFS